MDDDENIPGFVVELLEMEGYLVASAADGVEAVARVREQHPHLIELDLMMP